MNLKTIAKIQATVDRLKVLDAEIISLDKLGMQLADRSHECKVKFSVKDLAPPQPEKQAVLDEDGSLKKEGSIDIAASYFSNFYGYGLSQKLKKEDKDKTLVDFDLTDNELLQVIAFLINTRQAERTQYLDALEKLGVTFS